MELPKEKTKPSEENPLFLILFGKPKSGKTTIVSALDDALLIDLEKGSGYVEAMKVDGNSFDKLKSIKKALQEEYEKRNYEPVYTYGIFDTATALEEIILPFALENYRNTPMGKNLGKDPKTGEFKYVDIRTLPNGSGYLYIREAYKYVINIFKPYFKYLILLGHTKEKMINLRGKELSENTLDLSGKLERIISSQADALGFVYRRKNQTIINFNGGDDCIVEARPEHLRGQEIVIAETDENNKFTFHWDKIYKQ